MQIVRTIVWVLLLVALLVFSAFNWKPVEVKIWEGLVLETKIPALVVVSFLVGLVPMWLLHRASRFYMERRISSLETAARSAAVTPVAPPHVPEEPATEHTFAATAEPVVSERPMSERPVPERPAPEKPAQDSGPLRPEDR